MNLRRRVILSLGATLIVLILGIYFISTRLLMGSYLDLEQQRTSRNVDRAKRAFSQLTGELHNRSVDWAFWDDTYQFMKDRNRTYIQSNLIEQSLVDMRLDVMLFVDTRTRLFASARARRLPKVAPPNPQLLLKSLRSFCQKEKSPNKNGGFQGFIMLGEMPMMVSVRPILTTKANGPFRGWLVFGRYFDANELQALGDRTLLDIQMLRLKAKNLPADARQVVKLLSSSRPIMVKPRDAVTVDGYTLLSALDGKPTLLLESSEKRDIYQQGRQSVRLVVNFIVLASLVFSGVVLWGLERSVINRLMRLSQQVKDIQNSGFCKKRLVLAGRDEFASLASQINKMLAAISDRNAIFEYALEGISRVDTRGVYLSANTAYARLLGHTPEAISGQGGDVGIHPEDLCLLWNACKTMEQEGKAEAELRSLSPDGSFRYVEMTLIAAWDELGVFAGHHRFMKDVSERKHLEKQIEYQAYHDALTGLPNRTLYASRLQSALRTMPRNRKGIAVVFFDLDNFKVVNDSLGHEAGDILLVTVANRLQQCVRAGDTVARLSGDEFILLLENLVDEAEACQIAARIVESLRSPIQLGDSEVHVTGSIGIACTLKDIETSESLMRNADIAMYQAKAQGKSGYVLFEPDMNTRAVARMEVEIGLRRALELEELCVHYQPLLEMKTGRICGAEALVRWNHPEQGLIPPGQFIPIAEETGLIVPIGYWVLESACAQMKAWQETFPTETPMVVSVNLSGKQLQQADVVSHVSEILKKTGLRPECLKLEITESELVDDPDNTVKRLQQLRTLGVKLAIDDFGTGHSSISRLHSLPVNTLKIDRGFVSRLETEEEASSIIAAILMLAQTMKVDVTAEGIETEAQAEQLRKLGCDTGQGYLFARPLDTAAFSAYMEVETCSILHLPIHRGQEEPREIRERKAA